MASITEFLEARIAEDEARASSGWARLGDSRWETDNYGRDFLTPSAVSAECAAKRAIIDSLPPEPTDPYSPSWYHKAVPIMQALAAVYKDHPDYREEWSARG